MAHIDDKATRASREAMLAHLRTLTPEQLIADCDLLLGLKLAIGPKSAGLLTLFKEMLVLLSTEEGRGSVAYEHQTNNQFLEMTTARVHVDGIFNIMQKRLIKQPVEDNS